MLETYSNKTRKKYNIALDMLNISSCIAVIALHVNGAVWAFSYERYWKTSMLIETVFFWAVPVFFMITGATLIDYRERYDTKMFLKKRFYKTGLPFIFWSLISIIWAVKITHGLDPLILKSWKSMINAILNTEGLAIYWFFLPLFALYLVIPVLSIIPKERRKQVYGYLILYAFFIDSLLPVVCEFSGIRYNPQLSNPLNGGGYVIFLLLGYWITHYPLKKKVRLFFYCLGFCGGGVRYFYTVISSLRTGVFNKLLFNYTQFHSVLLAMAIFIWFWYHDWSPLEKPSIEKCIRTLSSASFGVYLIHFYITKFIADTFSISWITWQWRFFGVPLVYICSLAVVFLLKKIPEIKKIVP